MAGTKVVGAGHGGFVAVLLPRPEAGPVSQVAPGDKLSVALPLPPAVVFPDETLRLRGALGAKLILAGTLVLAWK